MKKIIVVGCIIGGWHCVQAQTFSEFFFQKSTQKKYLRQQIIALQAYILVLEKGYKIVQDGLNIVRDIKQGDFDLHADHFASLLSVSAGIGADKALSSCDQLMAQLHLQVRSTQKASASSSLSDRDKQYVNTVTGQLLEGATNAYAELSRLTTSGQYQMDDATRTNRIARLQAALVDRYAFARHFDSEVRVMLGQGVRASQEVPSLLQMYDLQ